MTPAPKLFIGIMSGTSCDGIDIAVVDPDDAQTLIHFEEHPMPPSLRARLLMLAEASNVQLESLGSTDRELGHAYAAAVHATLTHAGLSPASIAAIGCHGQTIRHRPDATPAFTLQIGCAATLAEQTGITVVDDFRRRDMAAGGEGAPLAPFAHRRLFARPDRNVAVLNIGGIANITWLGRDGEVLGFDCGPGNMLMDGLVQQLSGGKRRFDRDGHLAASGEVCSDLLERLLQHPFIHQPPPKSTGREDFGRDLVQRLLHWPGISDADRLATACACTVHSIMLNRRWLPGTPDSWLVCGGGARNGELMRRLSQALAPAEVHPTSHAGIPPQAVEAVCFALLAQHTLLGRANTLAQVTGARHDSCGGRITPGNNWPTLVRLLQTWTR